MTAKGVKSLKPINGILAAVLNLHRVNEFGLTVVDVTEVNAYANYLCKNAIKGVFVCGTTGDFSILSVDERLQIQEAWLEPSVRDMFEHVIVHIGTPVWEDLVRLGRHAGERGASAVAVTFPSFSHHAPQTQEHLIEYLAQVSEALPEVPLMLYNIHGGTPLKFFNNFFALIKAALDSGKVPTLAAVKYTSSNFIDAFEILNQIDSVQMCFGCDELILPTLSSGFKALIGSTYNLFGRSCAQMLELVQSYRPDEAKDIYKKVFGAIRFMNSEGIFMLNLRVTTEKLLQYRKYNFSVGERSKLTFVKSKDLDIAEKVSNTILEKYMSILNL
ncbi:N-acetylneuraminate lyase B-like [Convolutriloba macropyga]|uniref:N-acetylneuraminate lyase B-like n=1 Tax=Convolutriloba macropyga TaxID=536237 RepID=UPI003F5237A4